MALRARVLRAGGDSETFADRSTGVSMWRWQTSALAAPRSARKCLNSRAAVKLWRAQPSRAFVTAWYSSPNARSTLARAENGRLCHSSP